MGCMSKTRQTTAKHKNTSFPLRLEIEMRKALDSLARQNSRTTTEEARTAIRERLERHGVWPPSHLKATQT